ncbi:MAG: magnesium transporter CorA family protein [Archangium sp.]|nr:magnesium transporter CorA family protein [Archangium sp.]
MFAVWSNHSLSPTTTLAGARWVHAVAPTPEERERLLSELAVPVDFLRHALDPDEVSRIDHADAASFLIVRVPCSIGGVPRTAPLAFMLLKGLVVTVTPVAEDVLTRLDLPADLDPALPTSLVLRVLERVAERYMLDVRELDRRVDEVESRLERSLRNREVLELLAYQKGLVHIETALASNQIMMERLLKDERLSKSPAELDLLADVLVEFRQAGLMAEVSTNILSQMMDAFASIISNNLNVVMKVLTSLTLLFAIPTAVASFFGMNVKLPFGGHELAFEATLGVSVVLVVLAVTLFRRMRWL